MYSNLAKVLYSRGLLKEDVEIEAKYNTAAIGNIKDISSIGYFMIRQVNEIGDIITVNAASTRDGHIRAITVEDIITIDGMTPERFAEVYEITADGDSKEPVKRRGRKPKNRNIQQTLKIIS